MHTEKTPDIRAADICHTKDTPLRIGASIEERFYIKLLMKPPSRKKEQLSKHDICPADGASKEEERGICWALVDLQDAQELPLFPQ